MRFIDNGNNTVTDTTTNLIWLKDANKFSNMSFNEAVETLKNFEDGKWRLPTINELFSLIDFTRYNPALPKEYPFVNVQSLHYWSSTTLANYTGNAWYVSMWNGYVHWNSKSVNYYVWPVREA